MTNGVGSVFVRLFYKDRELSARVEYFKYVYSEKDAEEITLDLTFFDPAVTDDDAFQERAELSVIWGYVGGSKSNTRKIYIDNPVWSFSPDGIRLTIEASEKGTTLKNATSKKIYKKKNLPEIVKEKAEEHGLRSFIQVDPIKTIPIPQSISNNQVVKTITPTQTPSAGVLNRKSAIQKVPIKSVVASNSSNSNTVSTPSDLEYSETIKKFPEYKNEPQANRSDLQFLKGLANDHPDGPFIVETRDDTITLKKRDFSKDPDKSYTWKGGTGELLEFNPETKAKKRRGTSSRAGFSGWNPMNKSFFSSQAQKVLDRDPTYGQFKKLYETLDRMEKSGKGNEIMWAPQRSGAIDPRTGLVKTTPVYEKIAVRNGVRRNDKVVKNYYGGANYRVDNTRNVGQIIYTHTITSYKANIKNRMGQMSQQVNKGMNNIQKNLYNPRASNPSAGMSRAANSRKSAELEANPAIATLVGDPTLECGQGITILNVGKKYSGNYHITKVEHTIDSTGYFTYLDMRRQGHNKNEKAADSVSAKSTNTPVNTKVGKKKTPSAPTKKVLPTQSNAPGKLKVGKLTPQAIKDIIDYDRYFRNKP